ncbi:hypothetical protein AYO49_05680, partial [Verrucomicrobiaceae bacterium SCGC AG-212-N21]
HSEGTQPNFAYRVAVRLQGMEGSIEGRIGGPNLVQAANRQSELDVGEIQKLPTHLSQLTEDDILQVAGELNNPANLKTMVENDKTLMLKLATSSPAQLKGALALLDRGELSVDECYKRILSALPGHGAVMTDGKLDLVTLQGGALYQAKHEKVGDTGGYGDIIKLQKQGMKDGVNDEIILKKVRIDPKSKPEVQEKAWEMMRKEILLHSHVSEGTDKVVKFLEPVRIGDDLYLAMEYAELGSLNKAVFENGVGKVAQQSKMEPKVELALKLSYMQGMFEAMSEFGDDMGLIHHDNKPGNYFMTKDGDILGADLGTSSMGPESSGFIAEINAEQQSPEGCKHRTLTELGPPYGTVTTKSDCFAMGVQFTKFVMGHDMFASNKFGFKAEIEDCMTALYDHRDGFFMPPEPKMPDPATGPAMQTYKRDLAHYNKMKTDKELLERAGFTIHDDGRVLMFPEDGNPLHSLGNSLLSGDPATRMGAKDALRSQVMRAMQDPVLQGALKEMRAIVGTINTEETVKLKTSQGTEVDTGLYQIPPEKQQRLDELSKQVTMLIGSQEVWDDMVGQ